MHASVTVTGDKAFSPVHLRLKGSGTVTGRQVLLGRKVLNELETVVTPDTLMRWYRKLIARKWNLSHWRGPGRPGVMSTIVDLIVRMALENQSWGYRRIQGALSNLGHEVGRSTIANTLREHGIDPAPEGGSSILCDRSVLVLLARSCDGQTPPVVDRRQTKPQLARWLDSTILDALYGWNSPHSNFNVLMGINNTFGDMLINFVLGAMFLVLPAFWVSALAWAGIHAGGALQGLANGTYGARAAGQSGSAMLMKAAK